MIPLKDIMPRKHLSIIYGLVPYKIQLALAGRRYTLAQAFEPLFACMFLHGGFLHIIGNMLFLWVFGGSVEDRLGSVAYLFFYLLCGIGSGVTQVLFSWGSHVPSIGASGAISGVLGAYILFSPRARILTLVPLIIIWWTFRIPAFIFIGLWFLIQFLSGLNSLDPRFATSAGGVAWWAHVGGFLLGAVIAIAMRNQPWPKCRPADI